MDTAKAIYLCGFMGCGKSTVGKVLAKKTGKKFTDLDFYIEEKAGMKITEIFERHGESYFRELETKALSELGNESGVIATGGGALLTTENADIAKKSGIIVFIDTTFESCYSRIKNDPHRPIAFNSTKEELFERYNSRRPKYSANCTHTVSGSASPQNIAEIILKL